MLLWVQSTFPILTPVVPRPLPGHLEQVEPGRGRDHPLPGADPRDGGAGARLLRQRRRLPLPLGADPPQEPGRQEGREGLPPIEQVSVKSS